MVVPAVPDVGVRRLLEVDVGMDHVDVVRVGVGDGSSVVNPGDGGLVVDRVAVGRHDRVVTRELPALVHGEDGVAVAVVRALRCRVAPGVRQLDVRQVDASRVGHGEAVGHRVADVGERRAALPEPDPRRARDLIRSLGMVVGADVRRGFVGSLHVHDVRDRTAVVTRHGDPERDRRGLSWAERDGAAVNRRLGGAARWDGARDDTGGAVEGREGRDRDAQRISRGSSSISSTPVACTSPTLVTVIVYRKESAS